MRSSTDIYKISDDPSIIVLVSDCTEQASTEGCMSKELIKSYVMSGDIESRVCTLLNNNTLYRGSECVIESSDCDTGFTVDRLGAI